MKFLDSYFARQNAMFPIVGPVLATTLIILLCFGMYWGLVVKPGMKKYWNAVHSASNVSSAILTLEDRTITIGEGDARKIFHLIQSASEYSPNHPSTNRKGLITFRTDQGDITFRVLDTKNNGILLWAFSSGDTGWNYGMRRCDELGALLDEDGHCQAP